MPADVRPVDPELRHNMLGMTEAGQRLPGQRRRGRSARAPAGLVRPAGARLRGEDRRSRDRRRCAAGEVGELWLRGPFLMEGYYGRERHETFTPDGWYRTGDLFHVDDDGFFYFTGRRGDMIKTAGANVSPREVEAAIADATGLVAHVVGVDDPDRGQVVAAAVRVPRGQDAPDTDELRAALRKRLSAYKVPQRYLVLADDEVPMLSSGKLDARALKERFAVTRLSRRRSRQLLRRNRDAARREAGARHRGPRRSPTPSSTRRAARSRRGSSPPAWARAPGSACWRRTASSGRSPRPRCCGSAACSCR